MTLLAKNIVLAGVKSVTLYDPAPVQLTDLSTQVQPFVSRDFQSELLTMEHEVRVINTRFIAFSFH